MAPETLRRRAAAAGLPSTDTWLSSGIRYRDAERAGSASSSAGRNGIGSTSTTPGGIWGTTCFLKWATMASASLARIFIRQTTTGLPVCSMRPRNCVGTSSL